MQYHANTYAEDEWDVYWFERSMLGDIIAVYASDGTKLIGYRYDAWGVFSVSYYNGGQNTSATKNSFGYRGYYYDKDLGMYYLASRYYDAKICRFISPDSYISTGQGILGNNMYAYCGNNPVNRSDPSGQSWSELLEFINALSEDLRNFDIGNSGIDKVLDANYISSYKGALVIKGNFPASFSLGFIFLDYYKDDQTVYDKDIIEESLNHEYGHYMQLMDMSLFGYLAFVAIPSFTTSMLTYNGIIERDYYYGSPWEAEADRLGEVDRKENNTPWPGASYAIYHILTVFY